MKPITLSIAALLAATVSAHAEMSAPALPMGEDAVLSIEPAGDNAATIITRKGDRISAVFEDGQLQIRTTTESNVLKSEETPPPPKTIPGARPGRGSTTVETAWLTQPTKRYVHGILGDNVEAAGLFVQMKDGKAFEYRLPETSVFEDIEPRVSDLDFDGADEIVTIRSEPETGARMSVFRASDSGLVLVAETPPVALPFDWLLPVGAADFDGDGKTEIAVVVSPHLKKVLHLYRFDGKTLEDAGKFAGFSNHIAGSDNLSMGALFDANGDNLADIVLPSADRRALRIVSFGGGAFSEIANIALPSPIATAIVPVGPDLLFGTANGELRALGM